MRVVVCNTEDIEHCSVKKEMFAARRSVFIDLLKWKLPVFDSRYEVDQFDDSHARYVIIMKDGERHAASTRLLPTTRPHILSVLFPDLCNEPLPQGPTVLEITRFCLDRYQHRSERRAARNLLITALVDYALRETIITYTGVAEVNWFRQFSQFGWSCRALGKPKSCGPKALIPFRIDIDDQTANRMIATGIYSTKPHRLSGRAV
ncbi:acyl-homoserine-lactone synthase [Sphingomonas sp. R86520]|uniref:acyl-homoserine-lactone synthase n=1 Tax=Sphingomonas sp. R86520 TaxID=3093859 RepID=UPI0036D3C034